MPTKEKVVKVIITLTTSSFFEVGNKPLFRFGQLDNFRETLIIKGNSNDFNNKVFH